jgi:hypothetical protein
MNLGVEGFELDAVQARSLCGIKPDPFDPTILNRIARRQAKWRAEGGIHGIDRYPGGMAPKFWVQESRSAVSCPRCLAKMRAAMRPKLRYRPGIKALPIKPWRGDAGHYRRRVVADWGDQIWYEND